MLENQHHPNALRLDQLRRGMWFRHFDPGGKERLLAKVLKIEGTTIFQTPLYLTGAVIGYAEVYPIQAHELGLVPLDGDDGPQWNGYCLPF